MDRLAQSGRIAEGNAIKHAYPSVDYNDLMAGVEQPGRKRVAVRPGGFQARMHLRDVLAAEPSAERLTARRRVGTRLVAVFPVRGPQRDRERRFGNIDPEHRSQ